MAANDKPGSQPPARGAPAGGGTSRSPSFSLPSISLPTGGGAIRGIGEEFAANPATGTGSMSVPVATSEGRSGFGPQLSISYDSGRGNGPFGFGWSLSLPSVARKTDKGLPRYDDAAESDVFLLSDTEDLVPVRDPVGDGARASRVESGYRVDRYRPRTEGGFARVERWTRLADGDVHWRPVSRDNVTTWYGTDSGSWITDPRQVYRWLASRSFDERDDVIAYEYAAEDRTGVKTAHAHERCDGDVWQAVCYAFTRKTVTFQYERALQAWSLSFL